MTTPDILGRHPQLEPALRTFYRALPDLLADPAAGRFAAVTAGEVAGTWDTYRDALQHGLSRFDPDTFLVQRIDARLLDPLGDVFGPVGGAPCPG